MNLGKVIKADQSVPSRVPTLHTVTHLPLRPLVTVIGALCLGLYMGFVGLRQEKPRAAV